jgi:multicomponent Na+:H+ antiporter subunit G
VIEALVSLLVVLGAGLVLLASIGLVRLPDLYTRMHASTKPATLGVSLVVAALAVHSSELGIGVRAFLIVLFFLLTAPVAAHRLARAAYQAGVPRWAGTVRDELDEARRRTAASPERR